MASVVALFCDLQRTEAIVNDVEAQIQLIDVSIEGGGEGLEDPFDLRNGGGIHGLLLLS